MPGDFDIFFSWLPRRRHYFAFADAAAFVSLRAAIFIFATAAAIIE
jgi:hypothetical protein